jgi:hypothetical protein
LGKIGLEGRVKMCSAASRLTKDLEGMIGVRVADGQAPLLVQCCVLPAQLLKVFDEPQLHLLALLLLQLLLSQFERTSILLKDEGMLHRERQHLRPQKISLYS